MPDRKKFVRKTGLILAILLVVAGAVALWFETSYKGIVKKKLPALSAKASDSLYRAQTGDVDIDLGTRDVTFTNLELQPDAEQLEKLKRDLDLPPVIISVRIPKVDIRHLSVTQYMKDRELVADELHITNPVIRITRLKGTPKKAEEAKKQPRIRAVKAGLITITNPDVQFTDERSSKSAVLSARGGSIRLSDWRFDLREPKNSSRLFYASRTQLLLKALHIRDPSGLYGYSVGRVDYDQQLGTAEVSELRIKPLLSREAFNRRNGQQKEMYDARFPLVRFTGLDWQRLVYGKTVVTRGGLVRGGDVRIYQDRVPPPSTKNKMGNFPHQMLMKLKLPVYVPRLEIQDGRLTYTERHEKSLQEGTVHINRIRGSITNATNIPARIRNSPVCTVALSGDYKGSPIATAFHFPLTTKTGAFSVEGTMGAMDGTAINDDLRPLALAHITSMQLNGIRFRISGDQSGTRGTMTMLYQNLRLQVLEVDKGRQLDKKTATTALANTLLVYPANPMPGKEVRVANPVVKRDSIKSFFNVFWQTIVNGTVQSAQRRGFVDDALERKRRKQEKKRIKEELPDAR